MWTEAAESHDLFHATLRRRDGATKLKAPAKPLQLSKRLFEAILLDC